MMPMIDAPQAGESFRSWRAWPAMAAMAAAAASFAAPSARAQETECRPRAAGEPSPIMVGECRTSSLRDQKAREDYAVELRDRQIVQIDMRSETFDPVLLVMAPSASQAPIDNDQDGGGRSARIRFEAPVAGRYLIRAMAFPGESGSYSLRVREAARREQPVVTSLGLLTRSDPSRTRTDRFGLDTARSPDDAPYAQYTFEVEREAEALIGIDMEASGFDPLIRVIREGDPAYAVEDDDGGDGRNARLIADLPAGRYRIDATAQGEAEGEFTIGVRRLERSPPDRNVRPIEVNRLRDGELSLAKSGLTHDSMGKILSLYQDFTVNVSAGETYTAQVWSEAFDPVLDAGMLSAIGFGTALTNDDSCDSHNPRLVLEPAGNESKRVLLRVRSLGTEEGEFHIKVSDRLVECPPGEGSETEAP
jgi:hypothetical protein